MSVTLIKLSDFLRQYDSALDWLNRHGVRTHNTRLDIYRRVIGNAVQEEAQGRVEHQQQPQFFNAVVEASEIIDIAQLDDAHLADQEVHRKLKSISGGGEEMAAEGFDEARDNAFEFHTAAVLQAQGQFGGFSQLNGDLTIGSERYPAECKRVSSWNSLKNRLRDAREQLKVLVEKGSEPGVIVIDLTRPIRAAHGQIVASTDDQLGDEAERRLAAYLKEHVMTEENVEMLTCPSVLGVIAKCRSAGVVGDSSNIRRSVEWQACSLHDDDSEENQLFRRIATAFGPGELRQGSREELVDAISRIDVVPSRATRRARQVD